MGNLRGERLLGRIFAASRIQYYGQLPNNLVCGIWSTWSVVRCVETIPDLETGRSAVARSPGPHAESSLHITHIFMTT